MKEAKRHSEPTVEATAKAFSRFEGYTRHRDFKAFHFEQAIAFKMHLSEQKCQSGEKLSKATLHATLTQLKRFFQWLAWQPGHKSPFQYSDDLLIQNQFRPNQNSFYARKLSLVGEQNFCCLAARDLAAMTSFNAANRSLDKSD